MGFARTLIPCLVVWIVGWMAKEWFPIDPPQTLNHQAKPPSSGKLTGPLSLVSEATCRCTTGSCRSGQRGASNPQLSRSGAAPFSSALFASRTKQGPNQEIPPPPNWSAFSKQQWLECAET